MAQPTTFQLKLLHTDDVNTSADATSCISARDVALSHTDDPGGDVDDPGGGSTNDWGSYFTTSASTLSKAPASYVSSSLTTKVTLLKATADANLLYY